MLTGRTNALEQPNSWLKMYPTNQVLCTVSALQCHQVIQFLFSSRYSRTCYPIQASKIFLLWLGSLKSFGPKWLPTNWKLKRNKKHLTNNHLLHCCDFSLFWLYSDINLKEQYRLVELKKMLSQYGMRSFHVSYASLAKVCCERYRKIPKISPSMFKPLQILTPPTRNAKNPPLNRPSKYKPPWGLVLGFCPQIQG